MGDILKDVPEFFENELGESIISRTDALGTFRELGPPDLCHIIKANVKPGVRELGSYHYVSGVDASSSATLAAYLNSLTYSLDESQSWFSKSNAWRIRSGIYCCFNAFSRVDVRVEVKIPGGVESYVVDTNGERHEATAAIWQETFLSALLRAILYSDDSYYRLAGYRKIDPITSLSAEAKFLEAAESLFWQGWQLGSKPEIQVATSTNNHLTNAIMKYFGDSFRYGPAIALFEKLYQKDPEVAALLAQSYIGQNEEIKAVEILYEALKSAPMSYALLHAQIDFLRSKGKYDVALKLAKHAVNNTPSEFLTWAKLTEVYIDLEDYKSALLTLNSCPMFTYSERDMHRMPSPAKTHLPIKPEIISSGVMEDDNVGRDSEADPSLLRLPAPALHGTFSKAYSLLTRLATKVGWDDLLRFRSAVFVMEEEYRMQKAQEEKRKTDVPIHSEADKAQLETVTQSSEVAKDTSDEANGESKAEGDEETTQVAEKLEDVSLDESDPSSKPIEVPHEQLEKPQQAAEDPKEKAVEGNAQIVQDYSFSFSNKRLCERWLDNLFMVLYEDLRVYTFWRTEAAHYRQQHMPYRKTGTEWEILGDLGLRLWHENEAKEAFEQCLDHKFSAKAWMRLLEIYAKEGNVQKALLAAVKLTVYHERWYHEIVYPTDIACNLNKLIRMEGLSKMQNMLTSMNLPKPVQRLMTRYFDYGELFQVEGYEF
ncbi:Chs5p-Arf1p-binding proteins-domain-containing protein [Umbelopsis sp. AD052]|nr:Chs5p-Arf1p-binding proteins-domain-containing protein [Umbelopsis sp. AD052]